MIRYSDEQGRSMVELIGILCIIGLFTIGGIKFYRYGMDETIAQNTYEEVQQRAATSLERFNDRRYKFDARPVANETSYGYGITVAQHSSNRNYVIVNVTGVAMGVCKHIIRKVTNTMPKFLPAAGLILNGLSYQTNELTEASCPASNNIDMSFLFHRSKQANRDVSDVLNTCSSNNDCMQQAGDSTACLKCDLPTRLCVPDNDKCSSGQICQQTTGSSYPRCYQVADISSDYPCGLGECWRILDGVCVPDSSLCAGTENICGNDGFCSN